jgi:hypothetical protein
VGGARADRAVILALLIWLLGALGFFGIMIKGRPSTEDPPSMALCVAGAALWPLLLLAGLVISTWWAIDDSDLPEEH